MFEYGKQPLWRAAMAVFAMWTMRPTRCRRRRSAWRAMPRFGGRSAVNTWFMRILCASATTCAVSATARRRAPWLFAADGTARAYGGAVGGPDAGGRGAARSDRDEALDARDAIARCRPMIGWCWCCST
ncbi:MAG: hypothetical protein ACLSVD_12555 [Eggerthellaceae bacterium]